MTDSKHKADSDSKADQELQTNADGELVFPCRYPVKAMTRTEDQALEQVLASIAAQGLSLDHDRLTLRPSRNGRFQSITVPVDVSSRQQLEQLYAALRGLDVVVMTL